MVHIKIIPWLTKLSQLLLDINETAMKAPRIRNFIVIKEQVKKCAFSFIGAVKGNGANPSNGKACRFYC